MSGGPMLPSRRNVIKQSPELGAMLKAPALQSAEGSPSGGGYVHHRRVLREAGAPRRPARFRPSVLMVWVTRWPARCFALSARERARPSHARLLERASPQAAPFAIAALQAVLESRG
jgi:hypothetical protein